VVTLASGRFVVLDELNLCYRDEGDRSDEPVLMIMGLGSQLIHWPQPIVDRLIASGYRVIRFDNRDSGRTERLGETRGFYGRQMMAQDALQLLDHLEIDAAHVVGACMGGMIAQRLTINHPDRVRTLCSIMSSTGRLSVGAVEPGVIEQMIAPKSRDREEAIEQSVQLFERTGSQTYAEPERPARRALAEAAYERALDLADGVPRHPGAGGRHLAAILADGDRTDQLGSFNVPALVIHGNEDPLINISGGRATRDAIRRAHWLGDLHYGVDGMGHDLPAQLHEQVAGAIIANLAGNVRIRPRAADPARSTT
jgi:pimeloyl-ACP methyl ester carboxylesterase